MKRARPTKGSTIRRDAGGGSHPECDGADAPLLLVFRVSPSSRSCWAWFLAVRGTVNGSGMAGCPAPVLPAARPPDPEPWPWPGLDPWSRPLTRGSARVLTLVRPAPARVAARAPARALHPELGPRPCPGPGLLFPGLPGLVWSGLPGLVCFSLVCSSLVCPGFGENRVIRRCQRPAGPLTLQIADQPELVAESATSLDSPGLNRGFRRYAGHAPRDTRTQLCHP
jgi:hypothetical protein